MLQRSSLVGAIFYSIQITSALSMPLSNVLFSHRSTLFIVV